jgi:hypothetical protein
MVVREFGSLGGLMKHLADPSLPDKRKLAQVADLKAPEAKQRLGPKKAQLLMQLLMATDPHQVIDAGSDEESEC